MLVVDRWLLDARAELYFMSQSCLEAVLTVNASKFLPSAFLFLGKADKEQQLHAGTDIVVCQA